MRGHTRYIEPEPCSIGYDTVVVLLKQIGWDRAARLINHIGERDTQHNRESMRWQRLYFDTLARLHKYEPEAREQPYDPTPPPEASG